MWDRLINLMKNQDTIEGIAGIADVSEKIEKPPKVFVPPDDAITVVEEREDIFKEISDDLMVDPNLLRAFVKVEAGGRNFDDTRRVILRWETHIFKRYTGITINVHGGRSIQDNEWEAFIRASEKLQGGKYNDKAIMSSSWGIGQIMGFHYKRLKFDAPEQLRDFISESKENGLRAIGKFISTSKALLKACRERNYHLIASYYNGKKYKKYAVNGIDYAMKIEKEYMRLIAA